MTASTNREENTYPIDPENAAEMARLLRQDMLITKAMKGPLTDQTNTSLFSNVLDLACGPGGWVLDVARLLPEAQITGVDISVLMVNYGRATAKARGLHNAHFMTTNIKESFPFADNSFDLVNARYLVSVLAPVEWPTMLREVLRVCRPGGVIRFTETEMPITNSMGVEKITQLLLNAFTVTGRNFSPTARNFGITTMLPRLLRNAGCTDVDYASYSLDFSTGATAHDGFYQDYMVTFQLVKDFIVKLGLAPTEQYEEIYQQMLSEMLSEDFCGMIYNLTTWGHKPRT